ncbi:hypothetical protein P171DRAFT_425835 [Karstenula rhodostoma CBS 690.94]|uniref:Uncharacterized protein n=1 Tax=Karstenula rhodostoma CBS 690.94 TaxID=1392251 RepID=A0A9P4PY43_9PLEO|nr:hypothetical protein P171DRAFT_425835 [Karstenula rhodostoma CBS 690.94]
MCHVNDDFFLESLPMFLRHSECISSCRCWLANHVLVDIVIREAYTAYGLYFFLQATATFSYVYSLRYYAAATLTPLFAGPQLLKECHNLRHVWLRFSIDEFPSIHRYKESNLPFKLDKKAFLENHSFRQLLTLKHIEKVSKHVPPGSRVVTFQSIQFFWRVLREDANSLLHAYFY